MLFVIVRCQNNTKILHNHQHHKNAEKVETKPTKETTVQQTSYSNNNELDHQHNKLKQQQHKRHRKSYHLLANTTNFLYYFLIFVRIITLATSKETSFDQKGKNVFFITHTFAHYSFKKNKRIKELLNNIYDDFNENLWEIIFLKSFFL